MRVLIAGEGKSGTTALLRSVSAALGSPVELFEPVSMEAHHLEPESLVVKKLLLNWKRPEADLLDVFDKRVWIVRDPRDRLISHLLYDAYNQAPNLNAKKRQRWVEAVRQKAEDPAGVPMLHLTHAWWQISGVDLLSHYVRAIDRARRFGRRPGETFFVIKYEDYVDQNFAALEEYLGLSLATGVVRTNEKRVARSGSHSDWRRWFTDADLAVFQPLSANWLRTHGYDHRDWQLDPVDQLDAATTHEYVTGLFAQRPLSRESS